MILNVIQGYSYSLSHPKWIFEWYQITPYSLLKHFDLKSKSITFVHFSLLCGSRSSNAIRCSSLGSNDEELRLAGRIFFDNGGIMFLWKSIFLQLTRSWVGLVWTLERVKQKLWSLLQTMGSPPSLKTCWDYWIVIEWRTNF